MYLRTTDPGVPVHVAIVAGSCDGWACNRPNLVNSRCSYRDHNGAGLAVERNARVEDARSRGGNGDGRVVTNGDVDCSGSRRWHKGSEVDGVKVTLLRCELSLALSDGVARGSIGRAGGSRVEAVPDGNVVLVGQSLLLILGNIIGQVVQPCVVRNVLHVPRAFGQRLVLDSRGRQWSDVVTLAVVVPSQDLDQRRVDLQDLLPSLVPQVITPP